MTKADIVEKIHAKMGLSKKESAEIAEVLFSIMKKTLEAGENLKISGFGHFTVKQKADRVGRNPQTGEQLIIKSRQVVTFKPSNILRLAVNGEAQ
jgi:integration host factor subunit alpha